MWYKTIRITHVTQSVRDSPLTLLQSPCDCRYPCCQVLNGWMSCPLRGSPFHLRYCNRSTVLPPVTFVSMGRVLCPVPVVDPQRATRCKHPCPRCFHFCCCLFVHCICGGCLLAQVVLLFVFLFALGTLSAFRFFPVWYCPLTHQQVQVPALLLQNAQAALVVLPFSCG